MQVKHFTDYRSYLIAHIQNKKKIQPKWTLGRWAQQLDLRSTSSISKVISGERLPGRRLTESLISYFEFSSSESEYFKDLIRFHKVKADPRLALALLEKIGKENPNTTSKILNNETFIILSKWYGLALREMIQTNYFVADPKWLSKIFHFKVKASEISQCLKDLIHCRLIQLNAKGEYEVTCQRVVTENEISQEAIKNYHENSMDIAKQAVRLFAVENREFQASTFIMSSQNMKEAKNLIREFRSRFCKLLEETSGNQLFQIQIQFFPLTQELNKRSKNA